MAVESCLLIFPGDFLSDFVLNLEGISSVHISYFSSLFSKLFLFFPSLEFFTSFFSFNWISFYKNDN